MNGWEEDKRWADRFVPEIKLILGSVFIGHAPPEEDQERNTDLIVLKLEPIRIACRVRRFDKWDKYKEEFTIREGRPSGTKTELTKIIEGWGDYLFYAFANPTGDALHAYGIGDLKVFRVWFMRELARTRRLPGKLRTNHDGSSTFRAFAWTDLPPEFLRASWNLPETFSPF